MKISKKDALLWFSFFAQLDEEEATAAEADGTGLRDLCAD